MQKCCTIPPAFPSGCWRNRRRERTSHESNADCTHAGARNALSRLRQSCVIPMRTWTTCWRALRRRKAGNFFQSSPAWGMKAPPEHASFTFAIEGVSRALLAQITRHRIASYSVQSQRYVRLDQFEYITPPEVARDEQAREAFDAANGGGGGKLPPYRGVAERRAHPPPDAGGSG